MLVGAGAAVPKPRLVQPAGLAEQPAAAVQSRQPCRIEPKVRVVVAVCQKRVQNLARLVSGPAGWAVRRACHWAG